MAVNYSVMIETSYIHYEPLGHQLMHLHGVEGKGLRVREMITDGAYDRGECSKITHATSFSQWLMTNFKSAEFIRRQFGGHFPHPFGQGLSRVPKVT